MVCKYLDFFLEKIVFDLKMRVPVVIFDHAQVKLFKFTFSSFLNRSNDYVLENLILDFLISEEDIFFQFHELF